MAVPFYERLLPALGFTRKVDVAGWLQFEAGEDDITEFFGITNPPTMRKLRALRSSVVQS